MERPWMTGGVDIYVEVPAGLSEAEHARQAADGFRRLVARADREIELCQMAKAHWLEVIARNTALAEKLEARS